MQLAQGVLLGGELGLEGRDPVLGALHLLLGPGQLAGVGEQLLSLGVLAAGQLHQQRPLLQHHRGVARGEHARDGRRAGVLERRGRGLRHGGLRLPELGVGVVQVDAHLGQLGPGGGKLLAGLVELHADLVELRGELVDPGLDLGHGRLRSRAGYPAVDGETAHHGEPAESEHRTAMPRRNPDALASRLLMCLSCSLRPGSGSR